LNFRLGRQNSGPHSVTYPELEYGCPSGAAAGGSGWPTVYEIRVGRRIQSETPAAKPKIQTDPGRVYSGPVYKEAHSSVLNPQVGLLHKYGFEAIVTSSRLRQNLTINEGCFGQRDPEVICGPIVFWEPWGTKAKKYTQFQDSRRDWFVGFAGAVGQKTIIFLALCRFWLRSPRPLKNNMAKQTLRDPLGFGVMMYRGWQLQKAPLLLLRVSVFVSLAATYLEWNFRGGGMRSGLSFSEGLLKCLSDSGPDPGG
jgi:hypothetical protein